MINSVKSFLKVDQDHTSKGSFFKPISYSVSKIGQASVCGVVLSSEVVNKESDMPMIGSQKVLFWYECTIILQFFINLTCRKFFKVQVNLAYLALKYEHGD